MSLTCEPRVHLPPGWSWYHERFRLDRLPLGWRLRYAKDGSIFFHNTLKNYCTREDPRNTAPQSDEQEDLLGEPAVALRKSFTTNLVRTHPLWSFTNPQLHEDFEAYSHDPLKRLSSIRLLKWLGRNDSGVPSFSVEDHELGSTLSNIALPYAWGNPFPGDEATYGVENQWPDLRDGRVALVSKNLHDFLQHKDPRYTDTGDAVSGGSALHYATHRGQLETVANLLAIGANIDSRDAMERTPLFIAVRAQHEPVVRLLLFYGADTSLRASEKLYVSKYTPLHVAVELNNIALIEALLDTGASIEARVVSNLATLHIAIYRRDVIAVRVLLGRGADIETRALDVDAVKTPLFTAASNSDIECVKLLIEFGADIHATNEVMRTALHEAAEGDSTDLVQFLLN